jgi:PKD repeat protein
MKQFGIVIMVLTGFVAGIAFVYSCGGGGSNTSAATFLELAPVAKAHVTSPSGEVDTAIGFDGSASFDPNQDAINYLWDFGYAGSTSDLMSPSFSYPVEGTYYVTLTVVDSTGLMDVDTTEIMVTGTDEDVSLSTTASTTSGLAPLGVYFTADTPSGNPPLEYSWEFGDGSMSTFQNPSHVYLYPGTFEARATVTDQDGDQSTQSVGITVNEYIEPQVFAKAYPLSGSEPLSVDFEAAVLGGYAGISYSWDFGDGSALSTLSNPSHAYNTGEYLATCIVTDSTGRSAGSNLRISVTP